MQLQDLEQPNNFLDNLFEDINKLTEEFAEMQSHLSSSLNYASADKEVTNTKEFPKERNIEDILNMQLLTIQYSIKVRNIIITKLVPLLTNRRFLELLSMSKISQTFRYKAQARDVVKQINMIVTKYNRAIGSLNNLLRLMRQFNQDINSTQKVVNSFLALQTNAYDQIEKVQ